MDMKVRLLENQRFLAEAERKATREQRKRLQEQYGKLQRSLEELVDKHGLPFLLDAMANVCYEKEIHLQSAWQDEQAATDWREAAWACEKAATTARDLVDF